MPVEWSLKPMWSPKAKLHIVLTANLIQAWLIGSKMSTGSYHLLLVLVEFWFFLNYFCFERERQTMYTFLMSVCSCMCGCQYRACTCMKEHVYGG